METIGNLTTITYGLIRDGEYHDAIKILEVRKSINQITSFSFQWMEIDIAHS